MESARPNERRRPPPSPSGFSSPLRVALPATMGEDGCWRDGVRVLASPASAAVKRKPPFSPVAATGAASQSCPNFQQLLLRQTGVALAAAAAAAGGGASPTASSPRVAAEMHRVRRQRLHSPVAVASTLGEGWGPASVPAPYEPQHRLSLPSFLDLSGPSGLVPASLPPSALGSPVSADAGLLYSPRLARAPSPAGDASPPIGVICGGSSSGPGGDRGGGDVPLCIRLPSALACHSGLRSPGAVPSALRSGQAGPSPSAAREMVAKSFSLPAGSPVGPSPRLPVTPQTPLYYASEHHQQQEREQRETLTPPASGFMRLLGGVEWNDEVAAAVAAADAGLAHGLAPQLVAEGSCGGAYYMSAPSGQLMGIFKPADEEAFGPNNPRQYCCASGFGSGSGSGGSPRSDGGGACNSSFRADGVGGGRGNGGGVAGSGSGGRPPPLVSPAASDASGGGADAAMRSGVTSGGGALRECMAFQLDDGFAGVPPTAMTVAAHESFCCAGDHGAAGGGGGGGGTKIGSFQVYVNNECTAEDLGPSLFPTEDVHRIAILDIRLANQDRHVGNILVQRQRQPQQLPQRPPDSSGGSLPLPRQHSRSLSSPWPYSAEAEGSAFSPSFGDRGSGGGSGGSGGGGSGDSGAGGFGRGASGGVSAGGDGRKDADGDEVMGEPAEAGSGSGMDCCDVAVDAGGGGSSGGSVGGSWTESGRGGGAGARSGSGGAGSCSGSGSAGRGAAASPDAVALLWPASRGHASSVPSSPYAYGQEWRRRHAPPPPPLRLVPIDHGFCLPHALKMSDAEFAWLHWPAAREPLSEEHRRYVESLDPAADIERLRQRLASAAAAAGSGATEAGSSAAAAAAGSLGPLPAACLLSLHIGTALLKRGVAVGLTMHDLGMIMTRENPDRPCALEEAVAAAAAAVAAAAAEAMAAAGSCPAGKAAAAATAADVDVACVSEEAVLGDTARFMAALSPLLDDVIAEQERRAAAEAAARRKTWRSYSA